METNRLHIDGVDAMPIHIDWTERDDWTAAEAIDLAEFDASDRGDLPPFPVVVVTTGPGELAGSPLDGTARDLAGPILGLDDDELDELDDDDPRARWVADLTALLERVDDAPMHYGAEGPMMSTLWPLAGLELADATRLAGLPLAVVTFDDDELAGIALTGGGMDLSWEIAAAYVRLGSLPPARLSSLPRMAGPRPDYYREVLDAYRTVVDVERARAERLGAELDGLYAYLGAAVQS